MIMLKRSGALIAAIILILSMAALLPDVHWLLSLMGHPRPHYFVVGMGLFVWFVVIKDRLISIITFAIILVNAVSILPLYIKSGPITTAAPTFSIIHLNTNRGEADISSLVENASDILFLQEVTPTFEKIPPKVLTRHRLIHSHPSSDTHGSAMWLHKDSTIKIISTEIIHLAGESTRPLLTAHIEFEDRQIQILSLHVIRPKNAWTDAVQQEEFRSVAAWSKQIQNEVNRQVIVVGDFNTTPWSPRFRRLLKDGQLQDSLHGFGIQNTWPANLPLWLGLPIDHAAISDGIVATFRKTKAVAGSDHAMIQVDMQFR